MSENSERIVSYDPLLALMAKFENVRSSGGDKNPFEGLSIEEILKKHIIDGIKKNLERHLETARETHPPLAIINDILLEGMKVVGELFGAGKMQLPFVLQSAEVMKTAVRFLEPFMEKEEGSEKGSILLATVFGDVHDIGKNLVDIILTNNGYRVVNIGIKQPISTILEQAKAHNCHVIGLSGLLVKSTLIMRDNLLEINDRGLYAYPVILGGAALTRSYVEKDLASLYKGRVFYAQDAFEGLRLMNELSNPTEAADLAQEQEEETTPRLSSHRVGVLPEDLFVYSGVKSDIVPLERSPKIPFYGARKFEKFDIHEVYKYINPIALFRGQWQYRKPADLSNPEFTAWLEKEVGPIYERMKRELSGVLKPAVKWGYFYCRSEGNDLIILEEDGIRERLRFNFPRQRDLRQLCISDFFRGEGEPDVVGFQLVTVGSEVSRLEKSLFEKGDYKDYLLVHGMGVETAEALAEFWHLNVRREMGIDDQEPDELKLLFSAKYRGARYSFGYPACPNLEDQEKLFELLQPQDIGVELSEEYMLVPEQSTSAIVVHHPEARYFNVR